jgi:hypothetical protein
MNDLENRVALVTGGSRRNVKEAEWDEMLTVI